VNIRTALRMAHFLPGFRFRCHLFRSPLRPSHLRNLIPQPDVNLRAEGLERFPLRFGGCRIRTTHQKDSEQGAAGKIQLLFQAEAVEWASSMW